VHRIRCAQIIGEAQLLIALAAGKLSKRGQPDRFEGRTRN
jgi:hypothetical protein